MLAVYLMLHIVAQTYGTDPCNSYIVETNELRSTSFITSDGNKSFICDRPFKTAWYRFTSRAGGLMPTSCPPLNACGSQGSIWLNGKHPDNFAEEKTVPVCVRVRNSCCAKTWNIKVKKCLKDTEVFYVYHLPPVPGCPIAYCAGKERPCPFGEDSNNGFTPCIKNFPVLQNDPYITVDTHNKRLRYNCIIHSDDTSIRVRHEVSWYEGAERKLNFTTILLGNETVACFQNTNEYGEEPQFHLGQELYCIVRSYYVDKEEKGFTWKSQGFFAGFQVVPTSLVIFENGQTEKIYVTSTVPIICADGTENCVVRLEYHQTDTREAVFVGNCVLLFKAGPAGFVHALEVLAKRDFIDEGDQYFYVRFLVPDHPQSIDWDKYQDMPEVKVTIREVRPSRARSSGDPHVWTLDGLYYNHPEVGDFVLAKTTGRPFEVHVRTNKCGSFSCNCGVAAREGDDVIVIDMCRDNVPRVRFANNNEPRKGTTVERRQDGKEFELRFPSGSFVHPSRSFCHRIFRNIHRYFSPNAVGGLWKNHWIVWLSKNESLFYSKSGNRKCFEEQKKPPKFFSCSRCDGGKLIISPYDFEENSQQTIYSRRKMGWKLILSASTAKCHAQRNERIPDNVIILPDDSESDIYDYNPDRPKPDTKQFPTPSGMTKEQVESECRKAIYESTIGRACLKIIVDFDTTNLLLQCIFDALMMDSIRPAVDSVIHTLSDQCEDISLRDVKYWTENRTKPSPVIENSLCPNDCSGQGTCTLGKCTCHVGFVSSDCSMKEGKAPILIGAAKKGCDTRIQKCTRIRIVGHNFVDTNNLRCRITEFDVYNGNIIGKSYIQKSQLLSVSELSCDFTDVQLPGNSNSTGKAARGFYIELSNDGKVFTDNYTSFFIYDSKCMKCPTDGFNQRTCQQKGNTCKIYGNCFFPNERSPNNPCKICDPNKRNDEFVSPMHNEPLKFPASQSLRLIAYQRQRWTHEIFVLDRENQSLSFFLIYGPFGMEISRTGVITWFPQIHSETYTFTVKVTNNCGKSANKTFEVETRRCPCGGYYRGECVWLNVEKRTHQGQCVCPPKCNSDKVLNFTASKSNNGTICLEPIPEVYCGSDPVALFLLFTILITSFVVMVKGLLFCLCRCRKRNRWYRS